MKPSAGSGVFLNAIQEHKLGFDIAPTKESNHTIQQNDFLNDDLITISFKYEQDQLNMKNDAINRYGNTLSGIVKLMQRVGGIHRFHRKAIMI